MYTFVCSWGVSLQTDNLHSNFIVSYGEGSTGRKSKLDTNCTSPGLSLANNVTCIQVSMHSAFTHILKKWISYCLYIKFIT